MNTAATELDLGRKCVDCTRKATVGYGTGNVPYCTDCYLAMSDDTTICYSKMHAPHEYAVCRSCIVWCENPNA